MADNQNIKNWPVFSVKCCNPFNEEKHPKSCKNTRNVTEWMCLLNLDIKMGMKICDRCRKKLSSEYKKQFDQTDQDVFPSTSKDDTFIDSETSINYLNKSLELIGESPLKKKKIQVETYTKKKIGKNKNKS